EAEDALQNALWNAWQRLETFREDSSFNTWLTSIVLNQSRMRLRELRRARFVSIDDGTDEHPALLLHLTDEAPDPERSYARDQMLSNLHREIRRLPAQFRQILLLYLENPSVIEAAA